MGYKIVRTGKSQDVEIRLTDKLPEIIQRGVLVNVEGEKGSVHKQNGKHAPGRNEKGPLARSGGEIKDENVICENTQS
jgi:hypothetical protein